MVGAAALLAVACGGGPEPKTPDDHAGAAAGSATASPARVTADSKTAGGATIAQIECGDFHSCALSQTGTVQCWGRGKDGQLGNGGSDDMPTPVSVAGLSGVKQIALGGSFSCALLDDGRVKCWGTGRITGEGKEAARLPPTLVKGLDDAELLAASGVIMCAKRKGGKSTCFAGRTPLVLPTGTIGDLAVASAHGCILDGDHVHCTGDDIWNHELRDVKVKGASQLVSGDQFACVLVGDKPMCFGRNLFGEFGRESDMDIHASPTEVPGLSGIDKLAAGETQVCARRADHTILCWGGNSQGELGIGTTSTEERPTALTGLKDVEDMCLASIHGCAKTRQGEVYCWGSNGAGQLGDGTREPRLTPTRVKLVP